MSEKKWIRWCLILLLALMMGCGEKEKKEDPRLLLIGSWRFSYRNIHSILNFKNNGTWNLENRVEGKYSKIVEKKGALTGTWLLEENRLTINVEDDGGGEVEMWALGSHVFEVVRLDAVTLVLKDEKEKEREWSKVRAQQAKAGEVQAHQTIPIKPLIVNVTKTRDMEKSRYLCIDLEVVLTLELPTANPEEIPPPPPLHPEVREKILIYLSSFTYRDLNSFDKIKKIKAHLETIMRPYFAGQMDELHINNVVVASSEASLDEFILQYPELMEDFGRGVVPPPPEEGAETAEEAKE